MHTVVPKSVSYLFYNYKKAFEQELINRILFFSSPIPYPSPAYGRRELNAISLHRKRGRDARVGVSLGIQRQLMICHHLQDIIK